MFKRSSFEKYCKTEPFFLNLKIKCKQTGNHDYDYQLVKRIVNSNNHALPQCSMSKFLLASAPLHTPNQSILL